MSPKRIAALATSYFPVSHADVILSRRLEPLPWDADWGWPDPSATRIASLYVAQRHPTDARSLPDGPTPIGQRTRQEKVDLSYYLSEKYGVPLFPTIRDTLTLGGDRLAVDGVLLIGEHGTYPKNEWGQHLYPRKELFDEVAATFRETGQSAPVFVDKHFSWNPDWAEEMVAVSRELGFPLMGGSSLPHHLLKTPAAARPGDDDIVEYVGLYHEGTESYGFHSLEIMQAQIENRPGGESGIVAVTALVGAAVWDALDASPQTRALFDAALNAAPPERIKPGDVRANISAEPAAAAARPNAEPKLSAFLLEFRDGLRAWHIRLEGHLAGFTSAMRARNGAVTTAIPRAGGPDSHFGHFARLNALADEMFLTRRAPFPVERTLLTTKTIAACIHALRTPGERIATPELASVTYQSLPAGALPPSPPSPLPRRERGVQ